MVRATRSEPDATLAEDIGDPSIRANLAGLAGRVHTMAKDHEQAARDFDTEAKLLRQAGRYADMVQALTKAGEAHLAANGKAAAAERFFRAARSTFAQGNTSNGLQLADRAIAAATAAGDPELLERIRAIKAEIERTSVGK